MTAKALLLRDVELTKWWVSVKNDPRFDMLMLFIKSELMSMDLTSEQIRGAGAVVNLLQTITDNEQEGVQYPTSGIERHFPKLEFSKIPL